MAFNPIISTPQPGLLSNIVTQIVIPKLVNKAIEALDNNTRELSNRPIQPVQQVVNDVIPKSPTTSKVRVEVNFYINDTGHEIPKDAYVPIRFI